MKVETGDIWSAISEDWESSTYREAPSLSVGIVLWPEFTLNALAGFVDALRLAADVGDRSKQIRCRWVVMSCGGKPVKASCGLTVTPDSDLQDPRSFDYVVVASGLTKGIAAAPPRLGKYLADAAARNICLIGLCTGGIVLAGAGLMKGRRCCVASFHVGDLEQLESGAIAVYDRLFLDDGDRITCAGGTASIDLACYLVERHCGEDRVVKLIDRLLVDRRRSGAHAPHRSWLDLRKIRDHRARRAVVLMEQHLSRPLSMAKLADRLNTSERNLERIFLAAFGSSPSRVYRTLRLHFGLWMLTHTEESITQIALECGFADASHFSKQFQTTFQATPTGVRNRAGYRKSGSPVGF